MRAVPCLRLLNEPQRLAGTGTVVRSRLGQAAASSHFCGAQAGPIGTWAPPIPGLHVRILVFLQVLHIRVMYVALCCTHTRQDMPQ